MKNFLKLIGFFEYKSVYLTVLCVVIGVTVYVIFKKLLNSYLKKNGEKLNKKKKTYLKLLGSIFNYVVVLLIIGFVLQLNGVNVTSLFAGIGVVSVILGLAVQDALKDIIMGLNIIFDDYFSVGDVIKIGEEEGKVIEIGLKVTKLKDVNNQNLYVVANRNIIDAVCISNQLDIDIPLRYEEQVEDIEAVLCEIAKKITKIDGISDCKYMGVTEFDTSAVRYKLRFWALPEKKYALRRDALKIIKTELDGNNIEIPYEQIEIHNN